MAKTRQPELLIQPHVIGSLKTQKFNVIRVSDKYKAGRPDLRIGHKDHGQLDVELKYCPLRVVELWYEPGKPREFDTGLSKLQWLKMDEMNKSGMPCIGLIYVEAMEVFFVTTVLRDTLAHPTRYVIKGNSNANIINGSLLMGVAKKHLKDLYG